MKLPTHRTQQNNTKKIRDRFKTTITALYQQNDETDGTSSIYRQPLHDILTMSNERMSNWLQAHKASTSYNASQVETSQYNDQLTHETER